MVTPDLTDGPLRRIGQYLSPEVRSIVDRDTPIPTIAARAAAAVQSDPTFVRADIGQITGLDPELEVLYSPPVGLEPLRAAVAELWTRSFALELQLNAANVTITTGAAEGLSLLLRCVGEGRRVGLPRGHWENYSNGVALARGKGVIYDVFDKSGGVDAEGLSAQVRDEGIEVLLVNFPCNPTGAVLSLQEAQQLAAVAREHDLIIIADEVYSRLRYDGSAPVSMLQVAPERAVVVSSASKEYLLPGARVGFVICAESQLTDKVLRKLVRANTASPNVLGQRALLPRIQEDLESLRRGQEGAFIVRVRDALRQRRDALVGLLVEMEMPLVGRAGHAPQGTIFLMARVPEWFNGDEHEFVEQAMQRSVVSVVGGTSFGLPGSVRFSYGGTTADNLQRLRQRLGEWRRQCRG